MVDDEDALRRVLSEELTRGGYQVIQVADGEAAISTLGKNKFDLVLLDIAMPNIGGIDVLRHIQKTYPAIKVIMITGFADLKHAMEAKEFGAVDFISKPFAISDVVDTIERVLAG